MDDGARAVALAQAAHAEDAGAAVIGCRERVGPFLGGRGAPTEQATEKRNAASHRRGLERHGAAQFTCALGLAGGWAQPVPLPSLALPSLASFSPGTNRAETRPPAAGSMFARPVFMS